MSSPYTQPSLTGYNASPPSDDGTAVTANALKWSKHIAKIGDPLKTFSQAIDSNLVVAFGKIFGTNITTKSGNYDVVSGDQGKFIEVTATATITLLAAATAGANFPLAIVNTGSGIVTVDGNSSETINGSTTITLNPGASIILTCNASKWIGVIGISDHQGSFVPTFSGFSSDPGSAVVHWKKIGDLVNIKLKFAQGTSDSTVFRITNWPAVLQVDTEVQIAMFGLVDNGSEITRAGGLTLTNASAVASFYTDLDFGLWTGSGAKGFIGTGSAPVFQYSVNNIVS